MTWNVTCNNMYPLEIYKDVHLENINEHIEKKLNTINDFRIINRLHPVTSTEPAGNFQL